MTREKEREKRWISIGVDRSQVDHIDKTIASLKVFGKPKYESRQAFVAEAVEQLLSKETQKQEVIAR